MRGGITPVVTLALILTCCAPRADLLLDPTMDDAQAAIVQETWSEFLEFAEARGSCIASVTVATMLDADHRGSYCDSTHRVHIRVPDEEQCIRETLIHEFTHHVDFHCPPDEEMRAAFTAAGPGRASGWTEAEDWSDVPAERFAEATIELIHGSRSRHSGMTLAEAELEIAAAWWAGNPLP